MAGIRSCGVRSNYKFTAGIVFFRNSVSFDYAPKASGNAKKWGNLVKNDAAALRS